MTWHPIPASTRCPILAIVLSMKKSWLSVFKTDLSVS
ncbi:hypothetical protein LINPERHAP1_LOCUS13321, partial [Linum perenne]